jgi:hypothetical protein
LFIRYISHFCFAQIVPEGYGVPAGEYQGKPGEAPEAILARILKEHNINLTQ